MNPILALIILPVCFGVAGRIDYEVALKTADMTFQPHQTVEANAMIANANKFDAEYARPCFNHPHDPRTPEADGDEADAIEDAIKDAREWLQMAETAAYRGDWPAARQRLIEARLTLESLVGDAQ